METSDVDVAHWRKKLMMQPVGRYYDENRKLAALVGQQNTWRILRKCTEADQMLSVTGHLKITVASASGSRTRPYRFT